jgi:hypothetical protein
VIVASLSCALNLFAPTNADDFDLPSGRNAYKVNLARPLEWIVTCPPMQLSLVVMGGSALPHSRLILMPFLAFFVLVFGACTIFVPEPYSFLLYAGGLFTHSCAMYFNRLQILEVSGGREGLFSGDSEFRKATLILMGTWFPFPLWYIMSPEGIGLIDDIVVLECGWSVLNVVSKFTLILMFQRIKDNYFVLETFTTKLKNVGALPDSFDQAVLKDLEEEQMAIKDSDDAHAGLALTFPEPMKGEDAASGSTTDLEPLERKMEQLEWKLMEKLDMMFTGLNGKIDESQSIVRDKLANGEVEAFKNINKTYAQLEARLEQCFEEQNKQQQTVLEGINEQSVQFPQKLIEHVSEAFASNAQTVQGLHSSFDQSMQTMHEINESQKASLSAMDGSLTQTFEGWAQQIIQESKAAAFTIQTKMAVQEECYIKRQDQIEQGIAGKLQHLVNASADGLADRVVHQTLDSTEKLHASILESEQHVAHMIKDFQADSGKSVEMGMGVFGNSLRAMIDNMQAQGHSHRVDMENNITSKIDSLLSKIQHQTQKQASEMNALFKADIKKSLEKANHEQDKGIKEFQKHLEDVSRAQLERHQDMSSAVSSVLEQACGAKLRAEECTQRVTVLCSRLGNEEDPSRSGGFDRTGASPSRPGTARTGNEGGRRTSGTSTQYSQVGKEVVGR